MKKLSVIFLYCYLTFLTLYEILSSRVSRFLRGEGTLVAEKYVS
jgi:hypothetical protein